MRRVAAAAASLAFVLIFTACSGQTGGGAAAGTTTGAPEPGFFCKADCATALKLKANPASVKGKVGLSLNSTAFSYGVAMRNEAEDQVKKYFPGIDLTVTDGQGNATKQSNDVDNLVARGIKVLLISPYQADALVPAIKRAEAAGVKVITVDRGANTTVTSYIAPNDFENGKLVGEYIAKQLNGKGKIVEITGTPGASPTIARHDGFMKGISAYPGIKVIASENGDYLRAPALTAMENILQRYAAGSFQAVYAQADDMASGVVQALQESNRLKGTLVGSINGQQVGLDLVKKGDLTATAVYATVAREGILAAAKVLSGEPLPKNVWLTSTLVTSENVSDVMGKTW
ncbi:MAG: ribose transporter substrate-binding protein [Microbacteriaceae bacterium]|nr:ribose transporter substrate-binding protein [Microbacteriaceae bacterium]